MSKRKRFPIRHFSLSSRRFGEALMTRTNTTFHLLRISKRIAIVWDVDGVDVDS